MPDIRTMVGRCGRRTGSEPLGLEMGGPTGPSFIDGNQEHMELSIPAVLKAFATAGSAVRELSSWRARARGAERALIGELRDNLHYLDMIADDGISLDQVVGKISLDEYKKLSNSGFDFNSLKKKRIGDDASLAGTDLAVWQGKETAALIESIYEKLNELRIKYPLVGDSRKYRWGVRVNNIRKRIWLLLRHVREK